MKHGLTPIDDVKKRIQQGERLLLAADEHVLRQLPRGDWIGGTIPYFMAEKGGELSQTQVYVTEVPSLISGFGVQYYVGEEVAQVYTDIPENGIGMVIMPYASQTELSFALHVHEYPHFAARPLIGWVTGVHLDDLDRNTPKIFDGRIGQSYEDGALMAHFALPTDKIADINIVNIFEQGDGDVFTFAQDAFQVQYAYINGEMQNFGDYIQSHKLDVRLPLVADYNGAMINIGFHQVDPQNGVSFYAPVFNGIEYKQAKPIDDYVQQFLEQLPQQQSDAAIFFSCNCILNYLYAELEGKRTGEMTGPMTFGEIAYQLVNQTLVYLSIEDV